MKRAIMLLMALSGGGATLAANNAPLSSAWNIAPAGNATSNGELVFRMTPADGRAPVEVTVPVRSGASDLIVARDIRTALGTQLGRDRFNVQLGAGANVLVSDPRGKPDFSLELIDSDVKDLRVTVQSVEPTASPTVPKQAEPATPPPTAPAINPDAPGNVLPSPGTPAPPDTPMPSPALPNKPAPDTPPGPSQPSIPSPANSPALPDPAPPPNATGGAGQPASAPPPGAGGEPASTPPSN